MSFWGDPVKAEIPDGEKACEDGENQWVSQFEWVNHDRGTQCMDKPKNLWHDRVYPAETPRKPSGIVRPFFLHGNPG
jgi:hypothetical protein